MPQRLKQSIAYGRRKRRPGVIDFYHRRFSARFTDDGGRITEVRLLNPTAEIDYPISPRLTLFDIVGLGTIDGSPAVSYAEMAWPPDYLAANVEARP